LRKIFVLVLLNEVYRKSAIGHLEKLAFSDFFKTRHSIFKKIFLNPRKKCICTRYIGRAMCFLNLRGE